MEVSYRSLDGDQSVKVHYTHYGVGSRELRFLAVFATQYGPVDCAFVEISDLYVYHPKILTEDCSEAADSFAEGSRLWERIRDESGGPNMWRGALPRVSGMVFRIPIIDPKNKITTLINIHQVPTYKPIFFLMKTLNCPSF